MGRTILKCHSKEQKLKPSAFHIIFYMPIRDNLSGWGNTIHYLSHWLKTRSCIKSLCAWKSLCSLHLAEIILCEAAVANLHLKNSCGHNVLALLVQLLCIKDSSRPIFALLHHVCPWIPYENWDIKENERYITLPYFHPFHVWFLIVVLVVCCLLVSGGCLVQLAQLAASKGLSNYKYVPDPSEI